jgi:SEC-C motif-containing protein
MATAATPEELVRSRYSAFAVGDADYLLRTWSRRTRPARIQFDGTRRWTGLDVIGRTGGSAFQTEATVEFRAHYRRAGVPGEQRENSRFVREGGVWVYQGPVGG